jgi:hypothetical protein
VELQGAEIGRDITDGTAGILAAATAAYDFDLQGTNVQGELSF